MAQANETPIQRYALDVLYANGARETFNAFGEEAEAFMKAVDDDFTFYVEWESKGPVDGVTAIQPDALASVACRPDTEADIWNPRITFVARAFVLPNPNAGGEQ